jgi:hypothetical protein
MASTTNFNWSTPDDTALVKDGAAAIRTLGSSIDTSFVDLKGGTTGQVLAKASNTDLDFTWSNDAGISPTILDAKGDLITASAADTPARLGVGANGTVLTANSGATNGIEWAAPAAGGMTLINTGGTTLTGASVTISSIPTTYNDLVIYIRGVRPATDGTDIQMRFNTDSGTRYRRINGFSSTSGTFNETSMKICDDTDNGVDTGFITMKIDDYANTTTWKSFIGYATSSNHTTPTTGDVDFYLGLYNQTAAITSLTFFPGAGNWTSGTVLVYGVK